jgi:hypothetical protein
VVAPAPEKQQAAVQLATRLRSEQARAVLATDGDPERSTALARTLGLAAVVVVNGALEAPSGLTLYNLASSTRAESSAADLVRLARAEVEGRR